MTTVSATHAKQNFAAILDQSQREPVRIQCHERDVAVLVSAEYEKMVRDRRREFDRLPASASASASQRHHRRNTTRNSRWTMTELRRLVLDTNVGVSAALRNESLPHRTLLKARLEARLLASDETLAEFREVLLRGKFDRYVEPISARGSYRNMCALALSCQSFRPSEPAATQKTRSSSNSQCMATPTRSSLGTPTCWT